MHSYHWPLHTPDVLLYVKAIFFGSTECHCELYLVSCILHLYTCRHGCNYRPSQQDVCSIVSSVAAERHVHVQVKRGRPLKKNPLKNLGALLKLNPYAKTARRQELLHQVCFCSIMFLCRHMLFVQKLISVRGHVELDTSQVVKGTQCDIYSIGF